MQDINDRQRSVVFPDTVQNEARFWRNLGNSEWTIWTKIGLGILSVFVGGWITALAIALQGALLGAILAVFLVWGPIFACLAWATQRSLKSIERSKRGNTRARRH